MFGIGVEVFWSWGWGCFLIKLSPQNSSFVDLGLGSDVNGELVGEDAEIEVKDEEIDKDDDDGL